MDEIAYYDKEGHRSKKPPKGVPPLPPNKLSEKGGASSEDGTPTRPRMDSTARPRKKVINKKDVK